MGWSTATPLLLNRRIPRVFGAVVRDRPPSRSFCPSLQVKKVVKTVTTRTVQQVPLGPDGLPLETSPVGGGSGYVQTMDRNFRKNGTGGPGAYLGQPGTATLPRNYHYPDGYGRPYDDGGAYPGSEHSYGSLSRVTRIDERYRPSADAYRAPSRQDIYGPQPQVRVGGSNMDLNHFHPEPYGLEDDQRSVGFDDVDYGLMSDYGTARRAGTPSDPRRRLRYWGAACVVGGSPGSLFLPFWVSGRCAGATRRAESGAGLVQEKACARF